MTALAITVDDVVAAAERLARRRAPHAGAALDAPPTSACGAQVFFKCENLQRMGAFKFRGAYNALSQFDAGAARGRRDRVLVGQPRAGDRAVGAAARHAVGHRDAARRAGRQARGDARLPAASGSEVVLYDRYTEDREAIGRRARRASAA